MDGTKRVEECLVLYCVSNPPVTPAALSTPLPLPSPLLALLLPLPDLVHLQVPQGWEGVVIVGCEEGGTTALDVHLVL